MVYSGYRRNLNRSRRTFKRVYGRKGLPWYKRKYNAMELAGKAWSGVKAIRHLVNSEKLHLVTTSSAGISNNSYYVHLSTIFYPSKKQLKNCMLSMKFFSEKDKNSIEQYLRNQN